MCVPIIIAANLFENMERFFYGKAIIKTPLEINLLFQAHSNLKF